MTYLKLPLHNLDRRKTFNTKKVFNSLVALYVTVPHQFSHTDFCSLISSYFPSDKRCELSQSSLSARLLLFQFLTDFPLWPALQAWPMTAVLLGHESSGPPTLTQALIYSGVT